MQVFLIGKSQTTLPNLDMEQWISSSSGRFEDPAPATVWATPNYIMDLVLGNPSTSIVQKSTDKHGGNYAALMKTRTILGNLAGATLFTGKLNTSNPISPVPNLGVPFTGRPEALNGWHKYTSVNNDSSSIYIKLTKWNSSTNSRITVGFAEKRDYASVSAYTAFNLPVNYYTTDTPDSITLVFSASAGAEFNRGQVGSSLWIDDISFQYSTGLQSPSDAKEIKLFPNPARTNLFIETEFKHCIAVIIDANGKRVFESNMDDISKTINIEMLKSGNYVLQLFSGENKLISSQSFIKN